MCVVSEQRNSNVESSMSSVLFGETTKQSPVVVEGSDIVVCVRRRRRSFVDRERE